jgi:drug/metabolite transporter (DMT)-like permease
LSCCRVCSAVSKFDALQLTIITTIRKFLTIIASILVFGHELSALQYAAIASVFVGTVVHTHDSVSKKSSQD